MLQETHIENRNGVHTPMTSSPPLSLDSGSPGTDATTYHRVLGKLQYLSFTRPDISFCVKKLSQFMHCPKQSHWQAVKRLLRYLKHTCSYGLFLTQNKDNKLFIYSDWAGDPSDKCSTTGYVLYFGNNPINWSSKKQRTVARSSTEAEYRAVARAMVETNWVTNLLRELRVPLNTIPRIYCDNVGETYLYQNPVFHSRMKHIAIDFHFVRDQVQKQLLELLHIHTVDQVADTLTKPLSRAPFLSHISKLGLVETPPNLREPNNSKDLVKPSKHINDNKLVDKSQDK